MPWDLTYTARCAQCSTEVVQTPVTVALGQSPPLPTLPPGWWTFAGQIYCELHEAVIQDV